MIISNKVRSKLPLLLALARTPCPPAHLLAYPNPVTLLKMPVTAFSSTTESSEDHPSVQLENGEENGYRDEIGKESRRPRRSQQDRFQPSFPTPQYGKRRVEKKERLGTDYLIKKMNEELKRENLEEAISYMQMLTYFPSKDTAQTSRLALAEKAEQLSETCSLLAPFFPKITDARNVFSVIKLLNATNMGVFKFINR